MRRCYGSASVQRIQVIKIPGGVQRARLPLATTGCLQLRPSTLRQWERRSRRDAAACDLYLRGLALAQLLGFCWARRRGSARVPNRDCDPCFGHSSSRRRAAVDDSRRRSGWAVGAGVLPGLGICRACRRGWPGGPGPRLPPAAAAPPAARLQRTILQQRRLAGMVVLEHSLHIRLHQGCRQAGIEGMRVGSRRLPHVPRRPCARLSPATPRPAAASAPTWQPLAGVAASQGWGREGSQARARLPQLMGLPQLLRLCQQVVIARQAFQVGVTALGVQPHGLAALRGARKEGAAWPGGSWRRSQAGMLGRGRPGCRKGCVPPAWPAPRAPCASRPP